MPKIESNDRKTSWPLVVGVGPLVVGVGPLVVGVGWRRGASSISCSTFIVSSGLSVSSHVAAIIVKQRSGKQLHWW